MSGTTGARITREEAQRFPDRGQARTESLPNAPLGGSGGALRAPEAAPVRQVALLMGDAGHSAATLADRISRITSRIQDRLDESAVEQATEAGMLAGERQPGTRMQGGGTLTQNAFNRAAMESGFRRLETDARAHLAELQQRHEADPGAFAQAAQAYRDGLTGNLPPLLAVPLRATIDRLAVPTINAIREQQQRRVADDALASFEQALPGRLAEIQQLAQRATQDPAAAQALERAQRALRVDAARLGPRTGFRLEGEELPEDPTRTGALSAVQLERLLARVQGEEQEALVLGAWRASGGGRGWIEAFRRGQQLPTPQGGDWITREAGAGRPVRAPEQLIAAVPQDWRRIATEAAQRHSLPPDVVIALIGLESGGRANAVSPAGARGPMQIMPATAADPGLPGMRPLPPSAIEDPAQAIPWGVQLLAGLRDQFGGDLRRALAAYNGGLGRVQRAERDGRALPAETRNYLATLAPLLPGGVPNPGRALLPLDVADRIARRLDQEYAREEAAANEARRAAYAALQPILAQNAAAIAEQGRPVAPVSDEQLIAAGFTPERITRLREEERAGAEAWRVRTELRNASTPEDIARLAAPFQPGEPLFAADPQLATRVLALARERGLAIGNAGLDERVRDLMAQAEASGAPEAVTPQEAQAGGLLPEQLARINAQISEAARRGAVLREAGRMAPDERAAFLAANPVAGPQAAENAEVLRVAEREWRQAATALREDPAGYALAGSPAAQQLAANLQDQIARGDLSGLPQLSQLLMEEQRRLGVTAPQPVPKAMMEGLAGAVAAARDPIAMGASVRTLLAAIGPERLVETLRRLPGRDAETRGEAIAVAAMLQPRDPALARQIMAGAIALRETALPGVSAAAIEAEGDRVIGNGLALMPAARAQLLSAARALYAAEMQDAGRTGQAFDARRFRRAIERIQPFHSYGGREVPLPPGMDGRAFDRLMAALPPEALAGARAMDGRPITPAMVARGGFELFSIGTGRYELRYAGHQVLAAEGDRPFVLDLQAAAELRARAGR